jgi:hypothetical protein
MNMQQTTGPDYHAVRHVLSAPLIAGRTAPYIGEDDFDFVGLDRETETMSGGEALLVRIASELWTAKKAAGLWELPRRLDEGNFRRVIEALALARGSFGGKILVERPASGQEELAA